MVKYRNTFLKCQFYIPREYSCHNEKGVEAFCALGYMNGKDMRDIDFHSKKREKERFSGCRLELNKLT